MNRDKLPASIQATDSHMQTRTLTVLAFLAAINCAVESIFGNALHAASVPFTGLLMLGVNVIIYIQAHRVRRKPGTITLVAFMTILGNLAFAGAFKPLALAAILIEGIMVDCLVALLGFRKMSFLIASPLVCAFSFLYPVITAMLFIGGEGAQGCRTSMHGAMQGMTPQACLAGLGILAALAIHIASGLLFAESGWRIMKFMERAHDARTCPVE